jgi:hypothetical protein
MAGKIKALIDKIVEKRSQGNPTLMVTTKTKIMLKGVNPEIYTNTSDDDPIVEQRLKDIGKELGLSI